MGDAGSKPDNFSKRTRLRVRAEIYATKAREEGLGKLGDRGNDSWENIVPKFGDVVITTDINVDKRERSQFSFAGTVSEDSMVSRKAEIY
jgi:hypothetical protein